MQRGIDSLFFDFIEPANVNGITYANQVWSYSHPVPEAAKIAGLVCFYNEKVDIEIDGRLLAGPQTQFG